MIRHSGLLLTALLALALLFAPLPFGGVTAWAEATLRGVSFLALALAAAAVERPAAWRPAALPAAALAAVALLGLLQSAPLPAPLAALLSPGHAGLERQAAELAAVPAVPAVSARSVRLSLAATASRSAALGWAAAAAAFLAAAAAGARRQQRRWLAAAVLAGALFQVFFGAHDWFAHATTLWGVELHGSAIRLRGTFVNPNHLALYLELALPLAFAWGWWAVRRAAEQAQLERRLLLAGPPVLVWLTLFTGLCFTGSRAGLLAAAAAVSVQGALVAGARRRWWLAPLGVLAALAGVGVVAAIAPREGLGRLLATTAADVSLGARLDEYRAALGLWARFPVTGVGLGAFRDAFPLVQTPVLEGTWWHPHSDFLEVLVTAGLAGAALVVAGLWGLVRGLRRVLREGSRSEDRAAGLAALGVLVSAALHESLDFGLSMPGNALTLAILLGAATAAKRRGSSAQLDRTGHDLGGLRVGDLQHVEPPPERGRKPQRRRRARRRAQGEAAETGAVQA
ncbi:MAG TPA: O-antigen ligase family protein [Thermoanaerobaculia bacterium]|nr:O-antigen ligase family protein [Thermoanaerobaculia bacterium]